MDDIRQSCTACDGSGHLMVWDGHSFQRMIYKPHPRLPCTVCKGYGYMRPVDDSPPPVQQDAFGLSLGKSEKP